ncbi:hypothetical protein FSP39_006482, partial [Pinctada imbricata]
VYVKGYREPLSNFYRMEFQWQQNTFNSLEQAFQHEKARRHGDHRTAKRILAAKHAGIANKIGRDVRIHPLWDREKEKIMYQMLWEKSNQSEEFRHELLRTADKEIYEELPDKFWGTGRDGKGRNVLGSMLMDLRKEIKSQDEKPSVAIIGSSLIKNLRSDNFSRHFRTEVCKSYTIPEAKKTIRNCPGERDVVVYQLLSNDMKSKSGDECLSDLRELVTLTKELQPRAKIIISLPPNRGDSVTLNHTTNSINASVKFTYSRDNMVTVCDNSNLSYRGEPSRRYISSDGVHPTPAGEKVLFGNIRQAIQSVITC